VFLLAQRSSAQRSVCVNGPLAMLGKYRQQKWTLSDVYWRLSSVKHKLTTLATVDVPWRKNDEKIDQSHSTHMDTQYNVLSRIPEIPEFPCNTV